MNDNQIFNCDCIEGSKRYFASESVDLMICDPPWNSSKSVKDLYRVYRKGSKSDRVLKGYQAAPLDYAKFSMDWISEASRVLKHTGTLYIVSGFNNLEFILSAARENKLILRGHIIWEYGFSLRTLRKWRSCSASVLFYTKGDTYTFNTNCRFDDSKLLYADLSNVFRIPREMHRDKDTNLTKLPSELVIKMIQYSSNQDDLVVDFFLGNGTTAICAQKLQRRYSGFEINKEAYTHIMETLR